MQTRYFSASEGDFQASTLAELAEILHGGGVVAVPTETVYGLAARADHPAAVERIYRLKDRPDGLPLTLHLPDAEKVHEHVREIPELAQKLIDRYWPGPLTLILPGLRSETVGVRVPSHEVTRALLRQIGDAVVATSANPHGKPPASRIEEVQAYFDGRIEAALDGGEAALRQASTIVQVTRDSYRVVREGIITHEMVHQLSMGKNILFVCTGNSCRSPMAAALFQKLLAEKLQCAPDDLRERGYLIHSAGVLAMPGGGASEGAAQVMHEMGCSLSGHRTRPVTADLIRGADRVYALSPAHLYQILQLDESAAPKARTLNDEGIVDPIGGNLETYRDCAAEIERCLKALLGV